MLVTCSYVLVRLQLLSYFYVYTYVRTIYGVHDRVHNSGCVVRMRKGVKGHNHGNIVRKMSLRSVGQRSSCIATRRYCACKRMYVVWERVYLSRSDRGYSRKVQRMMRDLDREALMTRKETDSERKEKYQQRNWKQLSERELNKLTPVARSRYLAVGQL